MISKEEKTKIKAKFARHKKDTGSSGIQVALLTERINVLTEHLKKHRKDHHSRRGLFLIIGQRRRLLNYLIRTNTNEYHSLIETLGIRK